MTRAVAMLLLASSFATGCMSIGTNAALLSDTSHLGNAYSGTRTDLHTIFCMGRDMTRDASTWIAAPLLLFPLVDLPLSFALDTLLLPVDVPLQAERPPPPVFAGGCRLFGM